MILDELPFAEKEFKTHNFRPGEWGLGVCTVCGIRYSFRSGYYYKEDYLIGSMLPISCQEYMMRKALG